ncbi:Astakine-like [Homarus americanus]|uniref:Astakine-like n=1 Tax=Homarus americanus TaxID=6706 RepID=A0A8J5KE41_HOMAM|nr:Astakine-like [Homarus americanus]
MAGGRGVCVGVWVLLSVAGLALGRCSSSTDCGSLECCNVGMMRYSIPQCVPLGDLGSWCRINAEPVDLSLHYPNNQNVRLFSPFSYSSVLFLLNSYSNQREGWIPVDVSMSARPSVL